MNLISELKELASAMQAAGPKATKIVEDLLVGRAALADPTAKKRLTPAYLAERDTDLMNTAHGGLRVLSVSELLQRAEAATARRQEIQSPERKLREGRFVPLIPPEDHRQTLAPYKPGGTLYKYEGAEREAERTRQNIQIEIAERLIRADTRAELQAAHDSELVAAIQEAKTSANAAMLHLIKQEVAARQKREGREVPIAVKSGLAEAIAAIPPPADVQEALALIDDIERAMGPLADKLATVRTGTDQHLHEAVARVEELRAEGGDPSAVAIQSATERAAVRAARQQQAASLVTREVGRAVALEDGVGVFPAVTVSHNPTPTA